MRMMMKVSIPAEAGNKAVKDGTLPKTVGAFMEQAKPEGAYFVAEGGNRTAYFFFDMKDNASVPQFAEPFFMGLNASIEIQPAMNAEELRAGLERATKNR